jgi:hypothetical protein
MLFPLLAALVEVPRLTPVVPKPVIGTIVSLPQSSNRGAWTISKIGRGGEPYVSSDDNGAVYVSSHLPTQIFTSRDWGSTMKLSRDFKDSLGDMVALALPKGTVTVSYMTGYDKGMKTQVSTDFGDSFTAGNAPSGRPLDREWMSYDAQRDRLYMIYSDGYIGGPASKGVFVSVSADKGLTWKEIGRVDNEPDGNYPVDPHLAISTDGKLYGFWTVTKDRDTIESYRVSVSEDQGKTWSHHQTIADLPHDFGDRQERWMLGGITSHGASTVSAFYVAYRSVDIDVAKQMALVGMVRTSKDGGKTFGNPVYLTDDVESQRSAKGIAKSNGDLGTTVPWIQVMPWATYDSKGRLHALWFDNRAGVNNKLGRPASTWHLRYGTVVDGKVTRSSVPVSDTFVAARPAMDFICAAADKKYLYATWSQNENSLRGWDFTGDLWYGRMPLD